MFDILRVVRTYNERIGNVELDASGMPIAWTWRNHRYVGEQQLDYWVQTTDWWRYLEACPFGQIEYWLMQASSDQGSGQVELARDQATTQWRLVGIVD